jgi:heme/copper-type cytochrome/quinol oxidase subunit 2
MDIFFALIGFVLAYFIVRYRESIGDSLGEQDWMASVGGIYNVVVFIGILIFFWSLATITGTQNFFFTPIRWLLPFMFKREVDAVPVSEF